ncbi:MAG TPA: polysaccharide biosynthesis/export family protein [Rhizomicrobium sp.]|jgi:protein involved in polysaccharide export with SLBB domain|nr:polysaccharide biosynthesis/export family protein [Rhizomicrobium sp.]
MLKKFARTFRLFLSVALPALTAIGIGCLLDGCGPVLKQATPLSTIVIQDKRGEIGPYILQSGDELEVHHILDPDYSAVAIVAPDGSISVPGIPDSVQAKGLTLQQLTTNVNQRFLQEKIFSHPFFSLNLRSFGSLQVFVGGEVQRPGYLDLAGGNRYVMQVIASGGGFLPTARRSEVIVLRADANGNPEIFSVNLDHVIDGTDLSQNVRIHPMDVVFVPKSDIASLDTWIDEYIRQALPLSTSGSISYINQYVPGSTVTGAGK